MNLDFLFSYILGGVITLALCIVWKFRSYFSIHKVQMHFFRRKEKTGPVVIGKNDSKALEAAMKSLLSERVWTKNSEGHCIAGEKLTLYCALAIAAKEINGIVDINAGCFRIIMLEISRQYSTRLNVEHKRKFWSRELIYKFNNHHLTQHQEVLALLGTALNYVNNNQAKEIH